VAEPDHFLDGVDADAGQAQSESGGARLDVDDRCGGCVKFSHRSPKIREVGVSSGDGLVWDRALWYQLGRIGGHKREGSRLAGALED
jgi:hypothetical protein